MLNRKVIPWKEINRREVFNRYGKKIDEVVFEMPEGHHSEYIIRKCSEVVCILPITTDKQVILARQFRPGPKQIMLELPGGGIEKGETALEAVKRELLEETGYQGNVQFVTKCWDCAYSTLVRNCFVAVDCCKITEPKAMIDEYTEVELLSIADFRQLLRSGEMSDVEVGYLGLDYLGFLS